MQKHVSYTCNSGELIQIGREQLRNKRIFIYFPYCIITSLLGAIFITDINTYFIKPTFWIDFCSNLNQDQQCQQMEKPSLFPTVNLLDAAYKHEPF